MGSLAWLPVRTPALWTVLPPGNGRSVTTAAKAATDTLPTDTFKHQGRTGKTMTETLAPELVPERATASVYAWHRVCRLEDLEPAWGEAALVEDQQVAMFRLSPTEVYAVSHRDPATAAHVMARGIVGSKGNRPTIASPLHKEVYDLQTGECLSDPALYLRTFPTRLMDGFIEVGV